MTADPISSAEEVGALAKRYSHPPLQHVRSGEPLADVVYADPGNSGWYYRSRRPDSVAAYVRVDLLSSALADAEAQVTALTAERDALRAAKWDVQHTDTMNDFVLLGLDRDEWKGRAEAAEAQVAALTATIDAQASVIAATRERASLIEEARSKIEALQAARPISTSAYGPGMFFDHRGEWIRKADAIAALRAEQSHDG